jgi:tRNA dimethylallyltransferase
VIRALEVLHATGRPISAHHAAPSLPLGSFRILTLGIARPRASLRERVERRTERMFEAGLIDEARGLIARGFGPDLRPLRAIGYRQALAVVRGETDEAAARRDIVADTMRYAKRQMTWFRHQTEALWSPDGESAHATATAWLEANE